MKTALTIAGSDCSGGAGIQADLKTFAAHKVYGMSVITALTAQNTCGVYSVLDIPLEMVGAQLDAVFSDIPPDAVKIGMVHLPETIKIISQKLAFYKAENIVLDPVMVSTSGHSLMEEASLTALKNMLIPLACLITPNIPEAEVLTGLKISTREDMQKAAREISSFCGGAILIKGGHRQKDSDDLLYYKGEYHWFPGRHIETENTHGTGCTLSSAIAANLALGLDLKLGVLKGKEYINCALKAGLALGKGNGPLNHCCNMP